MQFKIVENESLTGGMAHIYSILIKDEEFTLLEQFFNDNEQYADDLNTILEKLFVMGHDIGCRRDHFKHEEGLPGDGVAALRVGNLRLYCLYFDRTAVIFGSGGFKPPEARAYQDVPELNEKAKQMKEIASIINKAIIEKDIVINDDGSLTINNWDYD